MEDSPENRLHEARHRYATAFLLYYASRYEPSVSDTLSYQSAICLLDSTLSLVPNFSDASDLRDEIWHCLLIRSKNTDEANEQYNRYLNSDAWVKKREQRMALDGNTCACGIEADHVHHKTYENIGKEPMTDLVSMCESCHNSVHQKSPRATFMLPGTPNEGREIIDDSPNIKVSESTSPEENQFAKLQVEEDRRKSVNPYNQTVPFGDK